MGKKPSPQTDIYSLGIVLYEMLTGGERPFTGEHAKIEGTTSEKVRWEQRKLPPPSPRKNNPAISHQLEKVVLTCLKKDPTQRSASTLDLLQALELAFEGVKSTERTEKSKVPIEQAVDELKPQRPKEIPKKLSSKARMRGIGTVVGLSVFVGIALMAIRNLDFLTGLINNSPAFTATSAGNMINLPISTQTSTEGVPTPTEPPRATLIPTEAATITTSAPLTEIDSNGALIVLVLGGEFQMGALIRGDLNAKLIEKPIHAVSLDAYYIDKFEVTNALYSACVDAGACDPPKHNYFFSNSPNRIYYGDPQYDNYPVVYVDWEMAKAYCEWRDARLPTEAEWEKASRGTDKIAYEWGEDVRIYPWDGTELTCQKANYQNCVSFTSEVGNYEEGKSAYGAYDMAGNVWEWVNDWYSNSYYDNSPLNDPRGPNQGLARVQRGGSWTKFDLRVSNRINVKPDYNNNDIGFRCARDVSP